MIKKCKDCEWAGPFGPSTIYPNNVTPNVPPEFMRKILHMVSDYMVVYFTKKRCCDCSHKKPCEGNPEYSGLKHWGYCANYNRKPWKFWRPK